jgi:DivIVA domain-containing protein
MPTSDLDMPLLPSAEQIRRREFATVRRGYDPQQVRGYLTSIAEQVETLERELSQLRLESESTAARNGAARPEPVPTTEEEPYEAFSKRFASLIEVADQEARKVVQEAQAEAARALEEARSEADRIKVDAQAHAEESRQSGNDLLERAKVESDRILSGLAERRQGLVSELEEMRSKLISLAEDLAVPAEDAAAAGGAPETETVMPAEEADPIDPRYEDLWVAKEDEVDIPDLAALDLDFDDQDR